MCRSKWFQLFFVLTPVLGAEWPPVDPSDLALKSPKVEKDAHAEAILWDVRISPEGVGTLFTHYLKIKIFDQRGAEIVSKVDIPYIGSVHQIAGRTTKQDGTVMELKKDAVFDRMLVKASGLKVKAKSFVLSGVEPGAVVEYRYEQHEDQFPNYIELQCQREIPLQTVRYHLQPLSIRGVYMKTLSFHLPKATFAKDKDGFDSYTYTNMPAFSEEPYMPPEHEVRSWMLVYYAAVKDLGGPGIYWTDHAREIYQNFKRRMKVDDEVKRTAAEVIADADTPEEKLRRLFRYCRSSIKNVRDRGAGLSVEEREGLKANKTPADTIRAGLGTGLDIDLLFGALATAAGFDARYAEIADRSQFFFNAEMAESYFLRAYEVAVKVNDHWSFFDPASTYVPFGMLRWEEEGTAALISGPKDPIIINTPLSEPGKSVSKRNGLFRLSESGELEGDVRIEHTGHAATSRRHDYQEQQQEERKEHLQKMLTDQYSGAEVTSIRIENTTDADKPLVLSYHIKVADYAQKTGKRLLLPIEYFQRNLPTKFSASERKYPVYFAYPWMETDQVSVVLPKGYELENAEMPSAIPLQPVGEHKFVAQYDPANRTLLCTRELVFGKNGAILFPTANYPALKRAFQVIHQSDQHVLPLKQVAPGVSN